MAIWYYELNGAQHGPVGEAGAAALLASGTLDGKSLVWCEGLADWVPLHQSGLSPYLVVGPSTPPPIRASGGTPPVNPYQAQQTMPAGNPYPPGPGLELTWKQILWSFEGRIPRRTYWAGLGIWLAIVIVVGLFAVLLAQVNAPEALLVLLLPLVVLYIWSALALQIKRWHDRNKSGAMVLINLIPYVGGIWTFVECGCLRGSIGPNSYGNDPT